jgi:hypothetical protein
MTENQAETHPATVSGDSFTETQQAESKSDETDGPNGKQDQDQLGDLVIQPSNKNGLQRLRRGEIVPTPVGVQVSGDIARTPSDQNSVA